ncbi:hypothetical protein [Streptomyces lydicus]|uniref:hypothetical protein n=1 Tax=Streptomyces lydicus TaxID=47763 RepID=UPI0037B1FA47
MTTLFGQLAYIFSASNDGSDISDLPAEEAARHRQAWSNSNELSKFKKARRNFLVGTIPAVAIGAFVAWSTSDQVSRTKILQGMGIALFIYCYLGTFLIGFVKQRVRREFRDRLLLGEALNELRQAENEISETDVSFQSLWVATQKRLDYYHRIATNQAEKSFLYGQVAACSGFFVLLTSSLIAALARSTTGSVVAGAAGVTASGVGAFIGSTFMRTQERASTQLEAYFKQPLELSKYLAAERLVHTLDQNDRSAATRDIIAAITGGRSKSAEQIDQPPSA